MTCISQLLGTVHLMLHLAVPIDINK